MKLLALHLTKPSNSEAKVLSALLRNLDDAIDVHLVLNRAGLSDEDSHFANVAARPNITVHHVDVGVGVDPWKPDNRLLRVLARSLHGVRRRVVLRLAQRVNADAVYTSQQRFDCRIGEIVSQSMRIPHVVHLHYTPGPYLRRPTLERLRTCDAVIAISDFIRDEAVGIGVDPSRITVIRNSIEIPDPDVGPDDPVDRSCDSDPAEGVVVGQVGRMFDGKGFLDTVRAFAAVNSAQPSTKLVLVGDGPQRDAVEALIDQLGLDGAVHITGWQPQVQEFLATMDVLVNTSLSEPFGMVVLEGMAHGVPVVAYRDGAVPEIVVPEETGVLVDPANTSALAEETLRLVRDSGLRNQLGAAGRKRAEREFSPRAAGDRFSRLLVTVAGTPGATTCESVTIGFVMERHLGLGTYADNLRRFLAEEEASGVSTHWYPVDYAAGGWWNRLPLPESVGSALAGRREARRVGKDSSVEAVVFNTQVPAVLGGRGARRSPHFLCTDVTPRQYDAMASGYGHSADRPGPVGWLKHQLNRRVFRSAERVFPWSDWVARSLVDDYGVRPERIEIIPPGVDTSTWRPRDGDRRPGPLRLLFVGGDFERKGGEAVLTAFLELPPDVAELTVVTRSEVAARPGVHVLNDVSANDPRLLQLYRDADVFVMPSRAETFGIAYIEASACGIPVIAGVGGGVGDIVVDEETGFIVPPDDPNVLADRLRQLVADPELRRRLGANARRRAETYFDGRMNARRLVSTVRSDIAPDVEASTS